ncbi:MFS transporter [Cupriavidus sp. SHE]|jgi:MFS transporter, putative metabolite:H+ symporter|uniref:MFS transporter n=1 Tax=Cupriavidus metallidurans TaxID=119219 RepID=A0A482IWX0_9BURK|nr:MULTISPECIES: MFS transporter [Cupriavidus]KWR86126.1 MFS transporter [Cupriavidus sp. SHE]QBP12093.1 MFS transporter [Cupriavidus metallidurans]
MTDRTLSAASQAAPARISAGELAARIDRLPATRSTWSLVLLLSLGAYFEFYELFSTAYVLPGIIHSGVLSATTEGFFALDGAASYIAATFLGLLIGVLAFGSIADRLGRRSVFTVALLWYSASAVCMAFQHDAAWLNFWRLMTGIGLGVELVTIDAYLSELVPARIRGRAFAVSAVISYLAVPSVALMAWWFVPRTVLGLDGWRVVVLMGGVGALFVWLLRLGLPESPRWLASHGRLQQATAVVEQLEAKARQQSGRPLPAPLPPREVPVGKPASFREIWRAPYRRRTVMLVLFHAAQAIGLYGFSNWMPTFLVQRGVGLSSSLEYGLMVSLVAPLGPLLAVAFVDRVERKTLIVVSALVMAGAGTMFVNLNSGVAILMTGALLTLGGTMISLGFHSYQAELYPTRHRAKAIGFVYAVSRVSGALSGFLIAASLKHAGVPGAVGLIVACMLLVALSIGLLGPRTSGLSLEEISQ